MTSQFAVRHRTFVDALQQRVQRRDLKQFIRFSPAFTLSLLARLAPLPPSQACEQQHSQ